MSDKPKRGTNMKLKPAMYEVTIGINDPDQCRTDNWRTETVVAGDVIAATKKIRLRNGEYFSNVELSNRATK
jgi:hypothetical protein